MQLLYAECMAYHTRLSTISDYPPGYLTDRLLVAMPSVQDSCFDHSLIYVCAHNAEGAMGVIVNAAINTIEMKEILEQLSIENSPLSRYLPVHFGGPVEAHRGFVLHSADYMLDDSVLHESGVAISANTQVLKALAEGKGPAKGVLILGYAGWSPGQLESEIETGSWIIAPADAGIIFDTENSLKWSLAAASLGIADYSQLSYTVGHA